MSNQLFFLSLADIFSVYPKIFRELIFNEDVKRKVEGKLAKDHIYLPSDEEWLEKVYHRLLEVQKKVNEALESGMTLEEITKRKERPIFDPTFVIEKFSPSSTPNGRFDLRKRCAPDQPIEFIDANVLGCWPLENIAKAAKLLRKPPLPVEFGDEHEMRRVYSLIYDVFRYKVVMSNALTDVSFYAHNPQLLGDENRIWLMLFELFTRHFLKRKSEEIELQNRLYKEAEVVEIIPTDVADCLWKHRIRLAASISRMRIRSGALELSQLLPSHLQNEKVAIAAANPIVTGWINPFILENKTIAETYLKKLGLTEVVQGDHLTEQPLQENQYKWDRICPLFLSILPRDRSAFAQTDFIRNHYLIMQDRTFALAPAIVSQMLDHYELDGDVVQTHVSSPRSTAYLASLFRSINRVGDFLAYGCGSMLAEYKLYMATLGIRNVRLFAEPFASISLEVQKFGTVVGVLATPPNSFSAVADPIDLICSRGGDLNMLQVMTESEIGNDGKNRVAKILEEQRETLRLAMSRPQVQFVLYQTHSVVDCENRDMVERAVEHVNKNAFEKHLQYYKEMKRLEALAEAETVTIPASGKSLSPRKGTAGGASSATTNKTDDTPHAKLRVGSRENSFQSEETMTVDGSEDYTQIIKVPKTDEFEVTKIPDVCINQDDCLELAMMGCFIALVQRKEITRLDAKYLIKMAEERGLFGKSDRDKSAKSKSSSKKPEKVEVKKPITPKVTKSKKGEQDILIQRLNQATHASSIRSNVRKISTVKCRSLTFESTRRQCTRHSKLHNQSSYSSSSLCGDPRAKQWWRITVEYVQIIQKRYKKRKGSLDGKNDIIKLMKYAAYPLYLPCRDRRPFIPKEPYPVSMNYLDFDEYSQDFSCSDIRYSNDRGYWTT